MIIVKMPEKTPIATYLVNSSETGSILPEVCQKSIFNFDKFRFRWLQPGPTTNFLQILTNGGHFWPVVRVHLLWKYTRRLVKLLLQSFSHIIMNKMKLNGRRHRWDIAILTKESFICSKLKYSSWHVKLQHLIKPKKLKK